MGLTVFRITHNSFEDVESVFTPAILHTFDISSTRRYTLIAFSVVNWCRNYRAPYYGASMTVRFRYSCLLYSRGFHTLSSRVIPTFN